MQHKLSRRKFIGQLGCAAMGATTFLSTITQLNLLNAASALAPPPPGDYKALVCVLLAGGNDSYNMLVPRNGSFYTEYSNIRSNLALAQGALLPLNYTDSQGKQFGLHPSLTQAQQLFNQGKLAFVSNVGSLIQPLTQAQFASGNAAVPLGLFSHEDQIMHWQTSIPQERTGIGWAGRMADLLSTLNTNNTVGMNFSLSGSNVFQAGNDTVEFVIDPYGNSEGIFGYGEQYNFAQIKTMAVDNLLALNYQDIFKNTYKNTIRNAQDGFMAYNAALSGINVVTPFSPGYLSQAFKTVARTIAAREALGMSRQIFFINYGGWDHHDDILTNQVEMFSILSAAFGEFYSSLEELGMTDQVTTFTISDFARTLTSNGNGSDHAWGGNAMVMGGQVNGGQIYGQYPSLYSGNPLEIYSGILLPTTAADEYFAELALWFGTSPGDLSTVLPNIGNFYNPNSGSMPLGFLPYPV